MNALERGRRLVLIALAGLSYSACYDFNFPLDPAPRVPLDGRLNGVWRCLAMEKEVDEPVATLRVSPRTAQVARWVFEPASKTEPPENVEFDVHGSAVKGGQLLSAQETKADGTGKWSFVRYTFLLPDVLRLQVVKDEPFEKVDEDAKALRKEVEKRRGDPGIYDDFSICVRTRPETPSPSPTPSF